MNKTETWYLIQNKSAMYYSVRETRHGSWTSFVRDASWFQSLDVASWNANRLEGKVMVLTLAEVKP